MRRWLWWLMPPWGAKVRQRQAIAMLRQRQDEERSADRARIVGVEAILAEPTRIYPVVSLPALAERPLLTRGQAARTRLAEHSQTRTPRHPPPGRLPSPSSV